MHGFRGFISKMAPEIFLMVTAAVVSLLFICSWPQRFLFLRQYLPQEISTKWFMSFASLNTATNIQLAKYYNDLAEIEVKQGKLNEALAEFNKAIDVKTTSEVPFYNRGCLYIKLGNFDLAIKDLLKVIKMSPKFAPAYNDLGFIYAHQNQLNQAIALFTKALKIDPKYTAAYYNREMIYNHLKSSAHLR